MTKKKSKAERQKERRRAMERKRRETGWQPPPEPDMEREQLAADMAPLLVGPGGEALPEHVAMIPFIEMILGSGDLVDEPEFDGVYAHPLLSAQAFAESIQKLGLEEIDPDDLAAPEREETYAGLMEEVARQVLTPELQEAILSALEDLRERAREEGNAELVAHTAALYGFLDDLAQDDMWSSVGVVQAVISRSLAAGMEIYDIVEERAERAAAGKESRGLLRRIVGATLEQKMERVLAKYPGLADFMAEQVQEDWEAGAKALASGDLDVGFFSAAEISATFAEAKSLGLRLTGEGLVPEEGDGENMAKAFVSWLSSYVEELATPERLALMQARLDEFAMQEAGSSWLTFLSLASKEFEEADTSVRLRPLLVHALVGEMQNVIREKEEAEG